MFATLHHRLSWYFCAMQTSLRFFPPHSPGPRECSLQTRDGGRWRGMEGDGPPGQRWRLEERRSHSKSRCHGHSGHFLLLLTYALRACWSLTAPSLPFDDGVLLCIPNVMAWPVGQHPVHDRQLRLHGNLVTHGQAFSL